MSDLMRGQVKFYSPQKEYGFITPADGEPDVFVHVAALKAAGLTAQQFGKGDPVEFRVAPGRGGKGLRATDLRLLT